MEKATISIGEAMGELRKLHRLFESIKSAEAVMEILAEADAKKRELERDIEKAKKERADIEVQIETKVDSANEKLVAVEEILKKAHDEARQVKEEASKILVKAREDAAQIVKKAEQQTAVSLLDTVENQKILIDLREQIKEEQSRLHAVKDEVEKQKKKILAL